MDFSMALRDDRCMMSFMSCSYSVNVQYCCFWRVNYSIRYPLVAFNFSIIHRS